jgi:hypothetical protein
VAAPDPSRHRQSIPLGRLPPAARHVGCLQAIAACAARHARASPRPVRPPSHRPHHARARPRCLPLSVAKALLPECQSLPRRAICSRLWSPEDPSPEPPPPWLRRSAPLTVTCRMGWGDSGGKAKNAGCCCDCMSMWASASPRHWAIRPYCQQVGKAEKEE